jgi:hypothetical protein
VEQEPANELVGTERHDLLPVDARPAFLGALRRDRWCEDYISPLCTPLSRAPEAAWPELFWDAEAPHAYRNIAGWHKGDELPAQRAHEAMLAATEQRLRIELPQVLRARLAARNGGGGSGCRLAGTGATRRRVIEQVAPADFRVSFAELSRRVFPPVERPWAAALRRQID